MISMGKMMALAGPGESSRQNYLGGVTSHPPYGVGTILTSGDGTRHMEILSEPGPASPEKQWQTGGGDDIWLRVGTTLRPLPPNGWVYTMQDTGFLTYVQDPNYTAPEETTTPGTEIVAEWKPAGGFDRNIIKQWGWVEGANGLWTHPATGATGYWTPENKFINVTTNQIFDPVTGQLTNLAVAPSPPTSTDILGLPEHEILPIPQPGVGPTHIATERDKFEIPAAELLRSMFAGKEDTEEARAARLLAEQLLQQVIAGELTGDEALAKLQSGLSAGIPLWVWIAGGGAALYLFSRR